jgi:hypothetical protein
MTEKYANKSTKIMLIFSQECEKSAQKEPPDIISSAVYQGLLTLIKQALASARNSALLSQIKTQSLAGTADMINRGLHGVFPTQNFTAATINAENKVTLILTVTGCGSNKLKTPRLLHDTIGIVINAVIFQQTVQLNRIGILRGHG